VLVPAEHGTHYAALFLVSGVARRSCVGCPDEDRDGPFGALDPRQLREDRPAVEGTITRLVPERGFGFITGDDGQEFFFHRSALQATDFEELAEGVRVDFHAAHEAPGDQPGERPRAVGVRLPGHGMTPSTPVPMPEEAP
jgi:cold shock protein